MLRGPETISLVLPVILLKLDCVWLMEEEFYRAWPKISKPLLMNDGSEITFPEIIYKSPK
ncbi:MAG: hypothetical protein CM1200mP16_12090 [Nitrospina sp.]|nr:MAG: hypothetical protein CM1200mP16_12090 [Nitrospina sp.]